MPSSSPAIDRILLRSRRRKLLLQKALGTNDLASLHRLDATIHSDPLLVALTAAAGEPVEHLQEDKVRSDAASTNDDTTWSSRTFLKGTVSNNPHNDYCQHFVDTQERPQNFIREIGQVGRYRNYPKLREFTDLKSDLIKSTAHPPLFFHDPVVSGPIVGKFLAPDGLNFKFDVILVEPPLEEYVRLGGLSANNLQTPIVSWAQLLALDLDAISASRSFVFLWCGSGEGLELGRQCLSTWGFRRAEDICWIKTNKRGQTSNHSLLDDVSVLQRTKEHCLMGIKGSVKRSTDFNFIHANVDLDVIVADEPDYGAGIHDKPSELMDIIERFCLGRRRLHLFGSDHSIRPGWLTVGPRVTTSNYNPQIYGSFYPTLDSLTTGYSTRIDELRPKTPPFTKRPPA